MFHLQPSNLLCVLFLIGLIKQFLCDVDWGEVDYLLIDTPPGTSDEHLSVVQYLKSTGIDGAILVTTPQVGETNFFVKVLIDEHMRLHSDGHYRELR